jgi:hypothetical protein
MKKSFLYEFYGVSLSKSSHTMPDGQQIELGKVYSNPFARAFGKIKEDIDDDIDEYDVDEDDIEEMEDFIAFLKTKVKEKEAYNESLNEAEYQGRKVELGKPTQGDVKKFKVYVKNPAGKVVKVNFGHGGTSAAAKGEKTMRIRKSNPKARKSFRARHNCDTPGPRTKARYWSCRKW